MYRHVIERSFTFDVARDAGEVGQTTYSHIGFWFGNCLKAVVGVILELGRSLENPLRLRWQWIAGKSR